MQKNDGYIRLQSWLHAARLVRSQLSQTDIQHLAHEQNLSIQGVHFALEHLELNPSEQELDEFVSRAPSYSCVAVILASNVLIAPFRAIAWALAQSPNVIVRSSKRTPLLTQMLIEQFCKTQQNIQWLEPTESAKEDVETMVAQLPMHAALHAYGSRATLTSIQEIASARKGVTLELHGPGFGAMLGTVQEVIAWADAIAHDIIAFDQRGCLSPRVLIVQGHEHEAKVAAQTLHQVLTQWGNQIPRGPLNRAEAANVRSICDAMCFQGEVFEGEHHAVAMIPCRQFQELLPAHRMILILWEPKLQQAFDWLHRQQLLLTSIACAPERISDISIQFTQCRVACFGQMQRPRFDGPVDRR